MLVISVHIDNNMEEQLPQNKGKIKRAKRICTAGAQIVKKNPTDTKMDGSKETCGGWI